ncbi:MAG: hypothetical protein V3T76_09720 [candidate division NC10 bacterium]
MAIVQFGGGIVNLTGSVRGWTFQFTRAGSIVRTKPIQRKSSTPKQTSEQSAFVTQIQAFQVLSLSDKVAWDAFAGLHPKDNKFGQQKLLTGQNWFTTINSARARLGLAQLDTPPAHTLPVPITSFNLTVDATKIEIDTITPDNPTDTGLFIDTTFPISQLSRAQRSPFRATDTVNSGPFGTIDLTSDWETAHSLVWPAGGSVDCYNIGVRLQPVNIVTGITGPAITVISRFDGATAGIGFMEIGVDFIVT